MIFFLLLKRPQVDSQYPIDELDVKKKIDTRLSVKLHYNLDRSKIGGVNSNFFVHPNN